MIVIPDLFGSYQKGREAAIDANWKDLQNYENVESARHQNDAAALANLATMADFGVRRRMTQNEGTNSDLNTQLNVAQMPAKLNIAEGDAMYTGMQLGTMKANEDAIRQAIADQFSTYILGAGTGYNNAVVSHGKSTIGRNVFTGNYDGLYKAADGRTKADISQAMSYATYQPYITDLSYQTQVHSGKGALDAAKVNAQFAGRVALGQNTAALSGYQLSDANSQLGLLQTNAQKVTFARDQLKNISSEVRVLQEMQSAYSKDDPRWKNLQADIDNLRGKAADLGEFLGANFMLNYNPVKVYATTGTTSGGTTSGGTTSGGTTSGGTTSGTPSGTGTRTVVDAATGRAIQVPTTPANLFGTSTPTTTGTRAVVTNNVMGGHNYGGTVSNWDALVNSDAGRFIQNLFTYNPNNGGGVVGLGIPQVRQSK